MSNLQFDSGNSNASGKSSDLFSSIFLFLFSLPFIGLGLMAAVKGFERFSGNRAWNDLGLGVMGLFFFVIGCGLMTAVILGKKLGERAKEKQMRFPDKPWLWRDEWAGAKIKSSAMAQPKSYLVGAIVCCGMGAIFSAAAIPDALHKHAYRGLIVLILPLVGIGLFAAFASAWRSQRRFGDCFFEPAQIPIPLGGTLKGLIQTDKPLKLEHELSLRISCVHRVVSSSGGSRNVSEHALWQNENIYASQANLAESEPGHSGVPIYFKLPDDQPECYSRGNESIFWRLEAKSKMHGPGFHAVFDLPVFKVAGAADAQTGEPDPTATLQAPIEEIRREEHSKIRITDGPDGREFYFPAARNFSTALVITLVFAFWSGLFWILLHSKAPVIFPIVWGITDVLIGFGFFNCWFKSSQVTIDSTGVRAINRYLIFGRTRQFAAGDVSRFSTRMGMQSGSQVFVDIKLIMRSSDGDFPANQERFQESGQKPPLQFRMSDPSGVTVASSIASIAEANWLVAEMNKALGRNY